MEDGRTWRLNCISKRQINNEDDKRFSVHLPHHWCLQSAIKLLLNWALVHWLIEQPTDNCFDQNKYSRGLRTIMDNRCLSIIHELYCGFKVCAEILTN